MKDNPINDFQPEFTSWKQHQPDSARGLSRVVCRYFLATQVRGMLRENNLLVMLDELALEEMFREFLEPFKPAACRDPDDLKAIALKFVKTAYLPRVIYPKCFESWQSGNNEHLVHFWGLAFHDLVLPAATRLNPAWLEVEAEELVDKALKLMEDVKNRVSVTNYQHFEGLITFFLKRVVLKLKEEKGAKKRKSVGVSLTEILDSGQDFGEESRLRPIPKKNKEVVVSEDQGGLTIAQTKKLCSWLTQHFEKRTQSELLIGSPWNEPEWQTFLDFFNSGNPHAIKLMERVIIALLINRCDDLFEIGLQLPLFQLLEGDHLDVWKLFKQKLLSDHKRVNAEIACRAMAFIDQKIESRSSEIKPQACEELKDFARTTFRRLKEQGAFRFVDCSCLQDLYTHAYRMVMIVVRRDSSDQYFRSYHPELALMFQADMGTTSQEWMITLNDWLKELIQENPLTAQVFEALYVNGFTQKEAVILLGLTVSQVQSRRKEAEQSLKKCLTNSKPAKITSSSAKQI